MAISNAAAKIAQRDYEFAPQPAAARQFSREIITSVFIEDGCIDRYSGTQLIFPGTLLLISRLIPEQFPYDPHWKIEKTHMAYWELSPTIDHVLPVTRGGRDEHDNWVTTSMIHNSVKDHWTLEELGWTLQPRGNLSHWDGLLNWFFEYLSLHPAHLDDKTINAWHTAAKKARQKLQ